MRLIEEISLNAWPALQTVLYDGWVLRFAEGYTRRSNSVNPLYPSYEKISVKIEQCEYIYDSCKLKPVFKICDYTVPEDLDEILNNYGYRAEAYTSLQTLDLKNNARAQISGPTLSGLGASRGLKVYSVCAQELTESWFENFSHLNRIKEENKAILKRILKNIVPEKFYLSLIIDNTVIGCGMGVYERGYFGLYNIIVHENHRGLGYGETLMRELLAVAGKRGATTAYLQVMLENEPAIGLYAKLGFKEKYHYWYR